jgi:hypothetical protein
MKDCTVVQLFEAYLDEPEQESVNMTKRQFDVKYIVRNCVHKAVAAMVDSDTLLNRKAHRLNLLLTLLCTDNKGK